MHLTKVKVHRSEIQAEPRDGNVQSSKELLKPCAYIFNNYEKSNCSKKINWQAAQSKSAGLRLRTPGLDDDVRCASGAESYTATGSWRRRWWRRWRRWRGGGGTPPQCTASPILLF
jgi:hypothetical protein